MRDRDRPRQAARFDLQGIGFQEPPPAVWGYITSAADGSATTLSSHTGIGVDDVLHHSLGDAHGVDGVGCLIGGQADNTLDTSINSGVQHIISADDVGLDSLHGEELTGRNLFQSSSMDSIWFVGSIALGIYIIALVKYMSNTHNKGSKIALAFCMLGMLLGVYSIDIVEKHLADLSIGTRLILNTFENVDSGVLAGGVLLLIIACGIVYVGFKTYISVKESTFLENEVSHSLPLIPASVAWWIMTSIDRYMLLYMCGAEANGLYSVAHKFPTVISVVMTFFINAWQITAVRNKDDSDIGEFTSSIFEKLFCVGLGMAYFMILISKILGHLFFAKDFFAAWTMTPLLTVSTIFSTLSLFLGAQFTASKRSDLHLKSNIISMIANVILNLILIKEMGIDGAAYGTIKMFNCISIRVGCTQKRRMDRLY